MARLFTATGDDGPWAFLLDSVDYIDQPEAFPDTPIAAFGTAEPLYGRSAGVLAWSAVFDHAGSSAVAIFFDDDQDEWQDRPVPELGGRLRDAIVSACLDWASELSGPKPAGARPGEKRGSL